MSTTPTIWIDEVTYLNPSLLPGGPVDDDDDLDHLTCSVCDPEGTKALCGRDVSDLEESDDLPDLCVVCRELESCPRCGDVFEPWGTGA